jgi:hypothetical protein
VVLPKLVLVEMRASANSAEPVSGAATQVVRALVPVAVGSISCPSAGCCTGTGPQGAVPAAPMVTSTVSARPAVLVTMRALPGASAVTSPPLLTEAVPPSSEEKSTLCPTTSFPN